MTTLSPLKSNVYHKKHLSTGSNRREYNNKSTIDHTINQNLKVPFDTKEYKKNNYSSNADLNLTKHKKLNTIDYEVSQSMNSLKCDENNKILNE